MPYLWCRAFISSTMMVMITAKTPSLKASIRPFVIDDILARR